ncbi:MAG: hypothetical protein GX568_08965 [Candidatus Gastranaerophilales bacterium]|nr:hypothetical protein [Candidatus Gastranaerophilales bacterium]
MKKIILIIIPLLLANFCFANGRCEILERKILKNPNVSEVLVGKHDKWFQEIYWTRIHLKNGGYLRLIEFDRYLSGNRLGIEYIGINPDEIPEYEFVYGHYIEKIPDKKGYIHSYRMNAVRTDALSLLLKKEIHNVHDIINNYDEIYVLAETLAKETPEERTKRRKDGKIQDDPNFLNVYGNFESDKCWGKFLHENIQRITGDLFRFGTIWKVCFLMNN